MLMMAPYLDLGVRAPENGTGRTWLVRTSHIWLDKIIFKVTHYIKY